MRTLAFLSVLSLLILGSAANAVAFSETPSNVHRIGDVRAVQRAANLLAKTAARRSRLARPSGTAGSRSRLSSLEVDIVARINAQRGARGLRSLSVSRGLTAAAEYHSRQMGTFGFFEHASRNGTSFWRRIDRFYPAGRGYWSVGENLFWESPSTSGASTVHEWMMSPPHRQNVLMREYREVGVAAVHVDSAPGVFGRRSVWIVTADFGVRR